MPLKKGGHFGGQRSPKEHIPPPIKVSLDRGRRDVLAQSTPSLSEICSKYCRFLVVLFKGFYIADKLAKIHYLCLVLRYLFLIQMLLEKEGVHIGWKDPPDSSWEGLYPDMSPHFLG